jgi:beta-glucosidase
LIAGKPIAIEILYHSTNATPRMGFGIRALDDIVTPAAKEAASSADAVLMSVGFDASTESEGYDRSFQLPYGQDALIEAVTKANPRTIVAITSGGGVDMGRWIDSVPSVLLNWYPGQEGGHALAQILFGDASPSGKLPISIERKEWDNPTRGFYESKPGSNDIQYGEGLFLGYRYYTSTAVQPLFPFGFGLTYTSFQMSGLRVEPSSSDDAQISVSFDVQNTGAREGVEVCQVYVGLSQPRGKRPLKELKAFERVTLKPGEKRHVAIGLNERQLSYYDIETHAWRRAPGKVTLYVGDSSVNTPLTAVF